MTMDPDILIILRGIAQIAWNFWPAVLFCIAGLVWALIWERMDR